MSHRIFCDNCDEEIIGESHHYRIAAYSSVLLTHEVHYHENCFNATDIAEIMGDTKQTPITAVMIEKHNFPTQLAS